MALESVMGGLIVPHVWYRGGTTNFTGMTLDANLEAYAWVFQAPKDGTIDRLGFRTATITTGGDVDVRLETVDTTSGDPSGTLAGVNGNCTVTIADGDNNVWKEGTLTAGVVVTKGQVLACVVVVATGFNGQLASLGNILDFGAGWQFPYEDHFAGGSWSKSGQGAVMNVRYSDGTYPPLGTLPITAVAGTQFASDDTPDERGLIFALPFPARLSGVVMNAAFAGGGTIKVYDSDGAAVLTSLVRDPDQQATVNPGPGRYLFPASVELDADTTYRVTLLPASTTDNTLVEITVSSAAMLDGVDGGQAFHLTTRTNAGAWTETTTSRPMIHLLLDAFEASGGGGGGPLVGGRLVG